MLAISELSVFNSDSSKGNSLTFHNHSNITCPFQPSLSLQSTFAAQKMWSSLAWCASVPNVVFTPIAVPPAPQGATPPPTHTPSCSVAGRSCNYPMSVGTFHGRTQRASCWVKFIRGREANTEWSLSYVGTKKTKMESQIPTQWKQRARELVFSRKTSRLRGLGIGLVGHKTKGGRKVGQSQGGGGGEKW